MFMDSAVKTSHRHVAAAAAAAAAAATAAAAAAAAAAVMDTTAIHTRTHERERGRGVARVTESSCTGQPGVKLEEWTGGSEQESCSSYRA